MRIAHLTTVDLSLRYLILPQLEAALEWGESVGISAPGEYVAEIEERGIRHIALSSSTRGMDLGSDLRAMRQLWKVLRSEEPDILHTHNPKPGVYGRVLGRLAGVPIVVNTVHGLYATPDSSPIKRAVVYALEAVASRFSDAELVQNPEDLDLLRRLRIVAPAKLRLLGNGVDLERFNPERAAASREVTRAALGIQSDEVAVGMVGRLVAEKGIPELVDAVPSLHPRTRVFVVGPHDPDKPDALESDVLQRGTASGVEFLGMRPDVDALYGAFDLFVLPSHREGFPRAAMEAAASGLPLVLTDIRGCRQVVDHGVNGFLVPVQDPNSMAEAINSLVDDGGTATSYGEGLGEKGEPRIRRGTGGRDRHGDVSPSRGEKRDRLADRPAERVVRASFGHSCRCDFYCPSPFGHDRHRVPVVPRRGISSASLQVVDREQSRHGDSGRGGWNDRRVHRRYRRHRSFLQAVSPRALPEGDMALTAICRAAEDVETDVGDNPLRGWGGLGGRRAVVDGGGTECPGSGLGSRLVDTLLDQMKVRGVDQVKVVAGEGNQAAISLYSRCGFEFSRRLEVHQGVPSVEMIWNS
jgi:glycosyltransferase involved in cell wall biosynthesis